MAARRHDGIPHCDGLKTDFAALSRQVNALLMAYQKAVGQSARQGVTDVGAVDGGVQGLSAQLTAAGFADPGAPAPAASAAPGSSGN